MSGMSDVIVVGGGLHGMSAALHIARRGKRVLVLEKDRIAAHASSYSAGGVRTLGRHPNRSRCGIGSPTSSVMTAGSRRSAR
jgi:glycine/D-amino acid oxidase-like deaminating enzyme